MFILRRISGHGIQMNKALGKRYTYIGRAENPEEFRKEFEAHYKMKHVADNDPTSDDTTKNCYAFIASEVDIQPIFKNQMNFMMTESGQTFANLSYK